MAFFSEKKLKRVKIDVEADSAGCESSEVQKRLQRIDSNYDRLNEILANIELKFAEDSRFQEWLGDEPANIEVPKKRKRKWRSRKAK